MFNMTHYSISMVKSALRILGAIVSFVAAFFNITTSICILSMSFAFAEILGIMEEIFDKRKE